VGVHGNRCCIAGITVDGGDSHVGGRELMTGAGDYMVYEETPGMAEDGRG